MNIKGLILLVAAMLQFCTLQAQNTEEILSKMNEAEALADAKQYAEAADAYIAISQMVKGKNTKTEKQIYVLASIKASSNCYMSKNKRETGYGIAKELLKEDLTETERAMAEWNYCLNGIGLMMEYLGSDVKQYAKARALAAEVLPYAKDDLKDMIGRNVARAWNFEAIDCYIAGNLDQAFSCYDNARKEYDGIGHAEDALKCLKQMAYCRYQQYKYSQALSLYGQALTIAEQNSLTTLQIELLTDEKKIYKALDNRNKLAETIAAISDLINSCEQIDVSMYTILGDDAAEMGDYYLAETYYLKAVECTDASSEQWQTPVLYSKLRDAMRNAKDYSKALAYESKRVETQRAVSTTGHVFGEFQYHAFIYAEMNDRDNAILYIDKFLASVEEAPASERALAYTMIALVYGNMKEYATAIELLDKADSLIIEEYGENDAQRIDIIALKAGFQNRSGQYDESRKGYRQYYDWTVSVYGEESTKACNALYYLANIEALCGNTETGESLYIEFIGKYLPIVQDNLRSVSASEREHYWQSLSEALLQMAAFGLKTGANDSPFTEAGYNALLFSKSLLLASEQSVLDILQKKGTPSDLNDYETIASLQVQINELSRNYTENRTLIGELNAEKLSLDRALTSQCKAYEDYTAFLSIRYADIKNALKPGEVVVDFTDYTSPDSGHVHAAYVIRKTDEHPLLLRVFNGEQIDSLLAGAPQALLYSDRLAKLALAILWQPLKPYIEEGNTVFYVPSGMMHQIALESIPVGPDSILGDKYSFRRLSSAREILNRGNRMSLSATTDATLFGGLHYEVDESTMTAQSKKYDISPLLRTRSAIRDVEGDEPFAYLTYSREEVQAVADILKENSVKVTTLTGDEGTEEAFLSLSGNAPSVLLISTHGFYYTPDSVQGIDPLSGYSDAMSLSGLIMAGANRAWRGETLPNGVQSGILTAAKIAQTNLEGNQLAVLSACQTAQGKTTSEGVYGLQRAFKKAGTGTIIMTLWSVNDLPTKDFMTIFFSRLTDNGWNKQEAFEYAKHNLRKRYNHPQLWAPFIMLDGIN